MGIWFSIRKIRHRAGGKKRVGLRFLLFSKLADFHRSSLGGGGCGFCAEICPMGSIDPTDVSAVRGICIKCCACVKGCPTGAKYFDDAGYLYHRHELEAQYARPAENEVFYL